MLHKCLSRPMRQVGARWMYQPRILWCSKRFCGGKPIMGESMSSALGVSKTEASSSESNAYKNLEKQIKGLSEDDQRLILDALQNPEQQPNSKMGGTGIGTKTGDMVAAFTCGRCDHRMVKKFSKHAYTKGIVIVECPSCEVRHLLADNLGWFVDEAKNIEDILKEKGDSFTRIGGDYQVDPSEKNEETVSKG